MFVFLHLILMILSGYDLVHATTVLLPLHVKNCDLIASAIFRVRVVYLFISVGSYVEEMCSRTIWRKHSDIFFVIVTC